MSDSNSIVSSIDKNLALNIKSGDLLLNQTLNENKTKISAIPAVVDSNTLNSIKNGEYGITLKDYTELSAYSTAMSTLYGNSSADNFVNYLNKLYGKSDKNSASKVSAKDFLEKMKENGVSNRSAMKIYSAIQKYSLTNYINNSFVNAKI